MLMPKKFLIWLAAISTAAPAVKPITTVWEMKLTSTPMRASPMTSWKTPVRKVSVSTKLMNCGLPGSASGLTEANTTMEIAVVGPDTRCQEEPNSAAMTAGTIAAYRPYSGGRPAIMAKATPWGRTMIAPVSPAARSARRLPLLTCGHQDDAGKNILISALRSITVSSSGSGHVVLGAAVFLVPLRKPHRAPGFCFAVPAPFVLGFEDKRRRGYGLALFVDGNKGEVCRGRVTHIAGHEVLRLHPHPDLHGGAAHIVQARLEEEQIAHEDGKMEIHAVDGRGDHIGPGMPRRDNARSLVDELDDHAAVDVPRRIRVLGNHHLRHDHTAFADPLAFHVGSFWYFVLV